MAQARRSAGHAYPTIGRTLFLAERASSIGVTIHNKAIAVAVYAKQAKDEQMVLMATEIKLRAERKAGELLREMEKKNGSRGIGKPRAKVESLRDDSTPELKDLGISRDESSLWQKLAKIPEK